MCVNSCGALSSLQPWAGAGSEVALLSARAWARGGPGMGEHGVVLESNVSWSSFPFRFLWSPPRAPSVSGWMSISE